MNTSMYIDNDVLLMIKKVSIFTEHSMSSLIIAIILKTMMHYNVRSKIKGTICYQKQQPESGWKNFHIVFKENEYEYFLQIRNNMKLSLSNFFWISFWICGVELLNKLIKKEKRVSISEFCSLNIPAGHIKLYETLVVKLGSVKIPP